MTHFSNSFYAYHFPGLSEKPKTINQICCIRKIGVINHFHTNTKVPFSSGPKFIPTASFSSVCGRARKGRRRGRAGREKGVPQRQLRRRGKEEERKKGGGRESLTRKQPTTNFCTSSSFFLLLNPPFSLLLPPSCSCLFSKQPPFSSSLLSPFSQEKGEEKGRRKEGNVLSDPLTLSSPLLLSPMSVGEKVRGKGRKGVRHSPAVIARDLSSSWAKRRKRE